MRLSERKSAGFPIAVVVLAAIAGAFAGHAVSVRSTLALPAFGESGFTEPQVSNAGAKTDSLPVLLRASITVPDNARYALARSNTGAGLERFYDAVTAAVPMIPSMDPADATAAIERSEAVSEPDRMQTAVALLPAAKPKPAPPPPAPMGLLDDGQIAGIKSRLRLTPEQTEYWPAVETALRAVAKTQLREMRLKRHKNGKVNIDVNSPEVQQLIWSAMPLLKLLREDQKREVRRLVRVIGLEQVASQI